MTDTIRIILADDHRRVHQAISEMIGFFDDMALVAQASNGQEAVDLCNRYQPDVVLMDVVMPVMDGVEATRIILEQNPDIKILALSSFKGHDTVRDMLESGAIGYVLKESSVDDLENTIRAIHKGQGVLSPEAMQTLLGAEPDDVGDSAGGNLSRRELEVLKLLAEGQTNKEIAINLSISVSTVKFHINNVTEKLGVQTRAELLVMAAKKKLI